MNWATTLADARLRHGLCPARTLRDRRRDGLCPQDRRCRASRPSPAAPGLTQILTALPAAVRARLPLVIFAGEAPLKSAWYNQAIDQAPFVTATAARPTTRCTTRAGCRGGPRRVPAGPDRAAPRGAGRAVRSAERAVDRARHAARAVASDHAQARPDPAASRRRGPRRRHWSNGAQRIVVMAGLGRGQGRCGTGLPRAWPTGAADCWRPRCPRAGLFHDDPFNLNVAGGFSTDTARDCFAKADLVIAVGASLASHNADAGKLLPEGRRTADRRRPRRRQPGPSGGASPSPRRCAAGSRGAGFRA